MIDGALTQEDVDRLLSMVEPKKESSRVLTLTKTKTFNLEVAKELKNNFAYILKEMVKLQEDNEKLRKEMEHLKKIVGNVELFD